MEFKKSLAKYYIRWYQDCLNSVKYCEERNQHQKAQEYVDSAAQYKKIIEDNKEAIEFFSIGDNAFLRDTALPKEFRGYK